MHQNHSASSFTQQSYQSSQPLPLTRLPTFPQIPIATVLQLLLLLLLLLFLLLLLLFVPYRDKKLYSFEFHCLSFFFFFIFLALPLFLLPSSYLLFLHPNQKFFFVNHCVNGQKYMHIYSFILLTKSLMFFLISYLHLWINTLAFAESFFHIQFFVSWKASVLL